MYQWTRQHALAVDAALALPVWAIAMVSQSAQLNVPDWTYVVLVSVQGAALVFRRVAVEWSFAVVALGGVAQAVIDMDLGLHNGMLLISLYTVAAYGSRLVSRVGLGVALLGALIATARYFPLEGWAQTIATLVGFALVVTATWTLGDVRGLRRAYENQLVAQAQQAERTRIAREMHDVVAHSLSVMITQADGGSYAAQANPAAARESLSTVADTGRNALSEMRRLLGVLRSDEPGGEDRAPQPGLAQLPELVDVVRRSGVEVELSVDAEPSRIPPGIGLVAYRIVQEALTNAMKHAGPNAQVMVQVEAPHDGVLIVVDDNGQGATAPSDGQGNGVRNMQERTGVYGGFVTARPRLGGGWRVRGWIPAQAPVAQMSGGAST